MTKIAPAARDTSLVLRELANLCDEFQLSWVKSCEPEAQWMAWAPNVGVYFATTSRHALQLLLNACQEHRG